MDSSSLAPIVAAAASQVASSKYTLIACWMVVVYDYLLTLSDEIRYMWRKNFSLVTIVFFANRYYSLAVFTLEVIENLTPFDYSKCKHYAPVQPLGEGLPFSVLPNFVIGLRVYALYGRNKWIGTILFTYAAAQLAIGLWVYTTPSILPVPLPDPISEGEFTVPALHLCLAVTSARFTQFQSAAFQFLQTVYDSAAFGFIICKTFKDALGSRDLQTIRTLIAKHGIVYYVIVFTTNFTWAMMIIFSPPGLKYACAPPTNMLASVSVNRLTISLRAFSEQEIEDQLRTRGGVHVIKVEGNPRFRRRGSWIGTSTFEVGTGRVYDSFELETHISSIEGDGNSTPTRTDEIP